MSEIAATLPSQARNDRECFDPVLVALSWTMALRPVITQRPGRQKG
jgi:hypothetical protein